MSETIGVCGDDCGECPRMRATEAGDRNELSRIAALWVRLGWRDASVTPEQKACRGCATSDRCAYPEQRACATGRGLSTCGECADYPCDLAQRAFERTETIGRSWGGCCSASERVALERAYAAKRENLDRIHARAKKP